MILEEETFEAFGYRPSDLKPGSGKYIIAMCELCGKVRLLRRAVYRYLCSSCRQIGRKQTVETRALISVAMKGRTLSEEHKAKIGAIHKGKIVTKETKVLMSLAQKGKTHTEETKALMCKNHADFKGKKHPRWNGGKRIRKARASAKYYRELGYTLIMPLAEGDVGHHVTNEYVIGIPKEVHQHLTGGGRKKHRIKVLQWLKTHDKKKYKIVLCVLAKEPLK